MSEADVIARTSTPPPTRASLARDLRALGLQPGMIVIVHSSLSALGWVAGGPVAVVQALMDVLTPEGALIMPTHSGDLTDPKEWRHPPVPEAWQPVIRKQMPAFDPAVTPTRGMGRIVETFRTWPGVRRSYHPHVSFAAWGRHRDVIIDHHSLAFGLGEESPLARIYDLDGWVLLLGVGHGNNTSFHLAEYRVPNRPLQQQGGPILVDGVRKWTVFEDVTLDSDPFPQLGADFERVTSVKTGAVGLAAARLFRQRSAVDYAVAWLKKDRQL